MCLGVSFFNINEVLLLIKKKKLMIDLSESNVPITIGHVNNGEKCYIPSVTFFYFMHTDP